MGQANNPVSITLPDGSCREFDGAVTGAVKSGLAMHHVTAETAHTGG